MGVGILGDTGGHRGPPKDTTRPLDAVAWFSCVGEGRITKQLSKLPVGG